MKKSIESANSTIAFLLVVLVVVLGAAVLSGKMKFPGVGMKESKPTYTATDLDASSKELDAVDIDGLGNELPQIDADKASF
jgi:hypothetical protein